MQRSIPLPGFWPAPAHNAGAEVEALAQQVRQIMALARGLASAGRPVELLGLDRTVGVLCAKMLDLPTEQGRGTRLALADLLSELDALSATLHAGAP